MTGPKSIWTPESNFLPNGGNNGDTTIVLDFAPDGVPYTPDSSISSGNELLDSLTCAEEHDYFDSLVAQIYASGDQEQINYLDSVIIPNTYFPACDSANNLLIANRRVPQHTRDEVTLFSIRPNPSNGNFTFVFPVTANYDITIFDAIGKRIFTKHVYNQRTEVVHLEGLSSGVYVAVVNLTGSKDKQVRKIVINH